MTAADRSTTTNAPRFAILTPAGRGAIATVSVRGPAAIATVSRIFQPATGRSLESFDNGRVVFGRFRTSIAATEELVVGLVEPDEVEIHCHGGAAAVAAICEALAAEGCRLVSADVWAHERYADPIQGEALIALADARTERAAAVLLDQFHGALRQELSAIQALIVRRDHFAALQSMNQLLDRAPLGLHLAQPWRIVLSGRPNVGKSSLINALLGYQRSIVWNQPGTTRDVLTATTAIDGWPVELTDTAGMRPVGDAIEAAGVARAEQQIASADLVIFVADTTAPWDENLFRFVSQRPFLVVHNKCDLAPPPADGRPGGLQISAKTRAGIDMLCEGISQKLIPYPPPRSAGVPFTSAQVTALSELKTRLTRGDLSAAQQSSLFQIQ